MNTSARLSIAVLATLGAGCSTFDTEYDTYSDKHSAYQLISRNEFEPIDLASLINNAKTERKSDPDAKVQANFDREQGASIDGAFRQFADRYRLSDSTGRARRTEIQERILAASDQRCNDFKTLLQKKISNVSFNTGLVTTGSAVAATIVDNLHTSKILSGIAGMASGFRAEYNQAYFANAAVQVIVAGIDSRRRTAYEQIRQARKESLATYPLEAAVKDAIRYHGLCSTVSGLQEAGEAVRYYNEPGITAATRTVARSKMLMDIQNASADQVIEKLKRWQEIVPAERYLAGNPLGEETGEKLATGQEVMDYYAHTVSTLKKNSADIQGIVDKIDKSIISDTEKSGVKTVAPKVEAAIGKFCQPVFAQKASSLLELHADLANAEGEQADRLTLRIQQTAQEAAIVKASLNYVLSNYQSRTESVRAAIEKLKNPPEPAQLAELKKTLAKLNAFNPVLAENCEIQKLE